MHVALSIEYYGALLVPGVGFADVLQYHERFDLIGKFALNLRCHLKELALGSRI
jgi:hypothetical protein